MKIVFLVAGLGEYAQAYAVALKLKNKGEEILFVTENEFLRKTILNDRFKLHQIRNHENVTNLLDNYKADALFLCNSHTTISYRLFRPKTVSKVFSLDSNWLFNNKLYQKQQTYEWIDIIYAVFPQKYFDSNLKENGGHYQISAEFKPKIICSGFIPSGNKLNEEEKNYFRKKIGVKPNEKVVMAYFGLPYFHTQEFVRLGQNILKRVGEIISLMLIQDKSVHLFNLSDEETIKKLSIHSSHCFNNIIGVADLIIMHHGYGTLPKIFNNQTPVINFSIKPNNPYHTQYFELSPSIKVGAIRHFFYEEATNEELTDTIHILLFNERARRVIKQNQKNIFIPGEESLMAHFYKQF